MPGPKSKKKELNPWLEVDRQSPDSGAAVTSSWDSRRSRVDLSDSEVSRLRNINLDKTYYGTIISKL